MTACIEYPGARMKGYGWAAPRHGTQLVHRQVAADHYGRAAIQGKVVMHECDNKACMNIEHLCVGTQKKNMEDARDRGLLPPADGERNNRAKLTAEQVSEIRAREGRYQDIADEFGVCHSTVSHIKNGRNWKAV